jgi:hypothetical protein
LNQISAPSRVLKLGMSRLLVYATRFKRAAGSDTRAEAMLRHPEASLCGAPLVEELLALHRQLAVHGRLYRSGRTAG